MDLSSSLLESLKPMILKLVKDAVEQALKGLFGPSSVEGSSPSSTREGASVHKPTGDEPPAKRPRKGKGDGNVPVDSSELCQSGHALPNPTNAKAASKGAKSKSGDLPSVVGGRGQEKAAALKDKKKGKGKGQSESQEADQGWTTVKRRGSDKDGGGFVLDTDDWDTPLILFSELAKKFDELKADETLSGVILCSESQVRMASTMAVGSKKKYRLLLLHVHKEGGDRIPGRFNWETPLRSRDRHKLVAEGAASPQLKGKHTVVEIAKKATSVLYVRVPKIYVGNNWQKFKQSPGRSLMAWAARLSLQVVDIFGWQEQKSMQGNEQIFALMRVENSHIKDILTKSGVEGVFIEPPRQAMATRVEWVERDKQESNEHYFERAGRQNKDLGLAVNGRSIGVRHVLQQDDRITRLWVLQDAPIEWGSSEASAALQQSFQNVAIQRWTRSRGTKLFFFKAKADLEADRDMVPIYARFDGNEHTMWAVWAHQKRGTTMQRPLKGRSVPIVEGPKLLKAMATAPTEPPTAIDDQGKETSAPKRARLPAQTRTRPPDLVFKAMPKDGNCVFHTLAGGLEWLSRKHKKPLSLSARELRARVVEHMRKHSEAYEADYDGKSPGGADMPWEQYLDAIAQEGAYASHLEIRAICRIYAVRVMVVPEHACVPCETFHSKVKDRVLVTWLTGNPCSHMDLLLPQGADNDEADPKALKYPQKLLDITAPPTLKYHVGGRAASCGSARTSFTAGTDWTSGTTSRKTTSRASVAATDWTRLPPQRESKRARTLSEVTPALDGTARSAVSSGPLYGNDLLSELESFENPVQVTNKGGRKAVVEWMQDGMAKCRICPFRKKVSDAKQARHILQSHFRNHHKGECFSGTPQFVQMPSLIGELPAESDFSWKCQFCASGITLEAAQHVTTSRIARDKIQHKHDAHPEVSWKTWRKANHADRGLKVSVTKRNSAIAKYGSSTTAPEGGTRFRWPQSRGKTIRFDQSWLCNACSVPFSTPKKLQAHRPKCKGTPSKARARTRLKILNKLKKRYLKNASPGPRRALDLACFDEATKIFQSAVSPFP